MWPASSRDRPKPFLKLVDSVSGFQSAVLRALPLAAGGRLVAVGAERSAGRIFDDLSALGVDADVLLEPTGRNTGPAIAAAAHWIATQAPDAILVILPADHHIADAAAFRAAIEATYPAVAAGRLATLGVRPDGPATGMGYILPGEADEPVKPVRAFEEKPTPARAAELILGGALWNSGVFVGQCAALVAEFRRWAPDVDAAASAAAAASGPRSPGVRLGDALASARSVPFDKAIMEQTDRGVVLPVDFLWSDLGAWDAVASASKCDAQENSLSEGARAPGSARVFVRAAPGIEVSVEGASDLIVVAEPGAVRVLARQAASRAAPHVSALDDAAGEFGLWLRTAALPLWSTLGVDPATGAFREALTWIGEPADPFRRTRVQARQTYVFASAAARGIPGPWLATARAGAAFLNANARRPDGLFAERVSLGGEISGAAGVYDHAFVLLAFSALARAGDVAAEVDALAVLDGLDRFRHRTVYAEPGPEPHQSNALMHLFEAALAWEVTGTSLAWRTLADEIADLALSRLIDPDLGALPEVFDADWRPLREAAGRIEPGHQLEWAWLLMQWGQRRQDPRAEPTARRLFAVGHRAFDRSRGVVVNAVWDDGSVRDAGARLWPQTEHLKAAICLGELQAALDAANGLLPFLATPAKGVWRERMDAGGRFQVEPAPATTLYHLYLAVTELTSFAG